MQSSRFGTSRALLSSCAASHSRQVASILVRCYCMVLAPVRPCATRYVASTKYFYRSRSCTPFNVGIAQKTLCSAPIRFSRRLSENIRITDSKFPFSDRFGLSSGQTYTSAEIIAGLRPLLTEKRLRTINKVSSSAHRHRSVRFCRHWILQIRANAVAATTGR